MIPSNFLIFDRTDRHAYRVRLISAIRVRLYKTYGFDSEYIDIEYTDFMARVDDERYVIGYEFDHYLRQWFDHKFWPFEGTKVYALAGTPEYEVILIQAKTVGSTMITEEGEVYKKERVKCWTVRDVKRIKDVGLVMNHYERVQPAKIKTLIQQTVGLYTLCQIKPTYKHKKNKIYIGRYGVVKKFQNSLYPGQSSQMVLFDMGDASINISTFHLKPIHTEL